MIKEWLTFIIYTIWENLRICLTKSLLKEIGWKHFRKCRHRRSDLEAVKQDSQGVHCSGTEVNWLFRRIACSLLPLQAKRKIISGRGGILRSCLWILSEPLMYQIWFRNLSIAIQKVCWSWSMKKKYVIFRGERRKKGERRKSLRLGRYREKWRNGNRIGIKNIERGYQGELQRGRYPNFKEILISAACTEIA